MSAIRDAKIFVIRQVYTPSIFSRIISLDNTGEEKYPSYKTPR